MLVPQYELFIELYRNQLNQKELPLSSIADFIASVLNIAATILVILFKQTEFL